MTRGRARRLCAVFVLGALLLGTACSKQVQTVAVHPSAAPGAPPAYDAALLARARDVVGGNGVRDGWRPAVVLAVVPIRHELGEILTVAGPDGAFGWLALCADDYTDAGWAMLDALLDPGDLIDYDTKGGDNAVCLDEVRVSVKGAALATATPRQSG